MIPATVPHTAVFKTEDGIQIEAPVVAWSDGGEALIASKRGVLTPARTLGGFVEVNAYGPGSVVAAIPGGGWHVQWKEGGLREPVAAWTFTDKGNAAVYVHDEDGSLIEAALLGGDGSYDLMTYHFTPTAARELAEDLLDAAEAMEQRFIEIPGGDAA